ncbi:MAG: LytTR family transcriptional regulator [Oscillospiraceae bacterium]|nr:LytTR family transcriptional regulator [Oscillospiraceae bacterium]
MDIEIRISSEYKIPKAVIFTAEITEEVNEAAARLNQSSPKMITGVRNNEVRVLDDNEIIRIYSSGGKITAETVDGEYVIRRRLYEMEEVLDSNRFVRISNSEIVNLKKVKGFDMSFTGTIRVTLSSSSVTYVSRRYVSKIKKLLGV